MNLRWSSCLLAGLLLGLCAMHAQAGEIVTVEKVIAMLEAKVDETTVMKISTMEGNQTRFEMTTDNIIKLKKAGATEKLIAWMIEEATKEQKEIQSDVQMFLNNARNVPNDNDPQVAEVFRNSRQKVLSHGQKSIPVLLKMLKRETQGRAKESALGAIYELLTPDYANKDLTEQLQQHLLADDISVRYAAAHAYAVMATQDDLETCFDTILKQHPVYTDGFVMVMAYSRNGNPIPKLVGLMENSEADVRRVAAFGIGYQHFIQKKEPTPEVLNLLATHMLAQTETTEVRIACAKAIADMGLYDDAMLSKVIQTAQRYADARPSMVMRMADFPVNNYPLLEYLVEDALEDRDNPLVVNAASTALRKLTKQTFNTIDQWKNWWRIQKLVLKAQKPQPLPAKETPPELPTPAGAPAGMAPKPPVTPAPAPATGAAPATPANGGTVVNPVANATTPPPVGVAPDLTKEQRQEVYDHLLKASNFNKSTDPKDWDTVIGHYEAALKIVAPLGPTSNWNTQFKSDLEFAQTYRQGLVLLQAKNYVKARETFEAADKIGFSREFTGVRDRLKEIERATTPTQAPAPQNP